LRALTIAIESIELRTERAAARAGAGYSTATDLADYLVRAGVPFRSAYEAVKALVAECLAAGTPLDKLTLEQLRAHHPAFGPDALAAISVERALAARDVPGGTAPNQVRRALADAEQRLAHAHTYWQAQTRIT